MKALRCAVPVLAILICSSACATEGGVPTSDLPNFHRVDLDVYRGAQPTAEGFQALSKTGIHTVIDLRRDGEDGTHSVAKEAEMVQAAGMRYINVPLSGDFAPSRETVKRLLALMKDPANGPIFIHCKRGADRTGTIVASYRIAHDHWNNADALKEANSLGMSWRELAMRYFVATFKAAS